MPNTLYVTEVDAARLREQPFTPILIGGYDGSQNYGDLLQCTSTISLYQTVCPNALVALVGELECYSAIERARALAFPEGTVALYFANECAQVSNSSLIPLPELDGVGLHFYGGGYINDMWGARKRLMAKTVARQCTGGRLHSHELSIVMTGMQVSPGTEVRHWKDIFAAAHYVGARDRMSVDVIASVAGHAACMRAEFCGDDALPSLLRLVRQRKPQRDRRIAVHISDAGYSTADSDLRIKRIADVVLEQLKEGACACDLIVGYPDDRINEFGAAKALEAQIRARVQGRLSCKIRNIFHEAVHSMPIAMDYDLVVTCSYHVALTAVLAGCPTILAAENDYYNQKFAGIIDQFPSASVQVVSARDGGTTVASASITSASITPAFAPEHEEGLRKLAALQQHAGRQAIGSLIRGMQKTIRTSRGTTTFARHALEDAEFSGAEANAEFEKAAAELAGSAARLRSQGKVVLWRAFRDSATTIATVEQSAARLPVATARHFATWFTRLRTQAFLLRRRCAGGFPAVRRAILNELRHARSLEQRLPMYMDRV